MPLTWHRSRLATAATPFRAANLSGQHSPFPPSLRSQPPHLFTVPLMRPPLCLLCALAVEDGMCRLRYKGPAPIGHGVKAAVKDKFPDIKEVVLVEDE